MASTVKRRPLPALVCLLALLLLTALVWWRVLHRGGSNASPAVAAHCPTLTSTASTAATALPPPSSVTVQMRNATSHHGIAAKARATLIGDGFKVPDAATNDTAKKLNKIKVTAELRYGPTGKQNATLLRFYFPGSAMVATTSKTATVIVALGTRYRSVATASAVQAALRKANLAAGSPTPTASGSVAC